MGVAGVRRVCGVHSWQNGTRCRDGVKVLWCCSYLVWLVFEGSIPTCACFQLKTFLLLVCFVFFCCCCLFGGWPMRHNRHCFSNIYTLMHEGVDVTKTVENGFERGGCSLQ